MLSYVSQSDAVQIKKLKNLKIFVIMHCGKIKIASLDENMILTMKYLHFFSLSSKSSPRKEFLCPVYFGITSSLHISLPEANAC